MCKPGSACCGSGATSSGFGIALAVIGTLAAVSMATVFISALLTAVLIGVFSVAAAQTIVVALILRRTRGVVTWPLRPPQLAAGRRPAVPAAARPAIPARRPQAIEAPAPAYLRAGAPAGSGDRAMVPQPARMPEPARRPQNVPAGPAPGGPVPEAALSGHR